MHLFQRMEIFIPGNLLNLIKIKDLVIKLIKTVFNFENRFFGNNQLTSRSSLRAETIISKIKNREALIISESKDKLLDEPVEEKKSIQRYSITKHDYESLFTAVNKHLENGEVDVFLPPLIKSQFDNVPPTIRFVSPNQKCGTVSFG